MTMKLSMHIESDLLLCVHLSYSLNLISNVHHEDNYDISPFAYNDALLRTDFADVTLPKVINLRL